MGRRVLQGLVMVGALVAGFWFGGELSRSLSLATVLVVAACVILGDLVSPAERWQGRVGSAVLAAICFSAGWYLAGREIDSAYAECARRGEEVREALATYHELHGVYPRSLADLEGIDLPGRRLLRPGLLEYSPSGDGYQLSFGDTVVRNTASDQRPFFSRTP